MDIFERIETKLEDICAKCEVDAEKGYFLAEMWTDSADEDVPIELDFDPEKEASDLLEELSYMADNFDADEYIEPYLEMRGTHGIPNSVSALLESANEAGEFYAKVRDVVAEALDEQEGDDE